MSSAKKLRFNQRQRTRAALVQAAMQAVQRGETPTIEDAAQAAGVSRATAYRYFASQQALLLETSLDALGTISDSRSVDEGPVESRVDAVIRSYLRMDFDHEAYLRTFLKFSMEQWLQAHKNGYGDYPVRKGRRLPWIDRALAPVKSLSPREMRRLRTALALLCGVEALVVTKDVCRCTAKEAEETCRWAARALLRAALDPSRSKRAPSSKRSAHARPTR